MSQVRHRRLFNPATAFPATIEPGELAINTANRQITAGDADPAALGHLLPVLAVRLFDARGKYAIGDHIVQAGQLYRCKAPHGPAAFTVANFEAIVGVDATTVALDNYLPLVGGTLSGSLLLPIAPPAVDEAATNKKYVDNQIADVILGNVSARTIINAPNAPLGGISAANVQDAINELDAEKFAKTGGVLTGQLDLPATPPPTDSQAIRKDYVDGKIQTLADADTTLTTTISHKVSIDGSDAMTGFLKLSSSAPTDALHAASKGYVDTNNIPATAVEYLSNDPLAAKKAVSPATAWASAAPVALPTATSVAPDFNAGIDFTWQLTAGGCSLLNPTNIKLGQKGMIYFQIASAGCNVGTWGTAYKFPFGLKPVFSTAAGAIDCMSYSVQSLTQIHCFFGSGDGLMLPGLITSGGPIISKLKPRYIDVGYSANTNLRALHDAYYNTYPPRQVVVFTVSSYVFSGGYWAAALDLSNFPADFEIILINNGHIRGAGGNGGSWDGGAAAPGGTALYIRNYVKIQNNGTIYGGGGGGGGSLSGSNGGSGGAGVNPGPGGAHYPGFGSAPAGTEYAGGYMVTPGMAGNGGTPGAAGADGYTQSGQFHGWPGGAAGYCWDGGGYILSFGTWDSVRNIWTNTGNPGAYLGPGA